MAGHTNSNLMLQCCIIVIIMNNSCDRSDIIHVVLVKPFQTYNYRVDEVRVLMHDTVVAKS